MISPSCRQPESSLRGIVRRIHGIRPARRVQVAFASEGTETLIEVDVLRTQLLRVGQRVIVKPVQYRLFRV